MRSLAILLFVATSLAADPPKLTVPAEVTPAGEYARFTPQTDCVSVTYIGLSGVDAFPSEELRDSRRFLLPTRGLAAGRYRFAAVGASKDGEQVRADFVVVVGSVPDKPPDKPPTTGKLYFLIVRPDGPTSPEFARYMSQPGWTDLHGMGYSYKDATLTEARALNVTIPEGTPLPCVVTLRIDGDKATVARGPITIPAPDAITKLPEGVK